MTHSPTRQATLRYSISLSFFLSLSLFLSFIFRLLLRPLQCSPILLLLFPFLFLFFSHLSFRLLFTLLFCFLLFLSISSSHYFSFTFSSSFTSLPSLENYSVFIWYYTRIFTPRSLFSSLKVILLVFHEYLLDYIFQNTFFSDTISQKMTCMLV